MGKFNESIRKDPPGQYSLKLKPLSLFLSSKTDKFDSGVFEAAGYKWRLNFYPNSHARNSGAKYIGLGLEIAETESLPAGWQVVINCKMFVYNKVTREYLVFEDVNDADGRRFHAMSDEWVFEQLMLVDTLTSDSIGHNDDDSCVFGVEIRLPKYDIGGETLSLTMNPSDENSIQWKIPSLAALDANVQNFSDVKKIAGRDWKLSIYPRGDERAKKQCLSLFLGLATSLPDDRRVYVEYKLRIRNRHGFEAHEKEGHEWLSKKITKMGFSEFIQLGDLYDDSKGWLYNNSLDVEGEIMIISGSSNLR
ncbi:hypothetical protein RJ639_040608 [Escallonia herrerae]|uniref:MATH domain-containing protein n=1 Tax=Escallonia herrerae TaxID=1293975 RepID=A0AA89B4N2_9ASTE|nr:hypothetical protein RJ639_040608 [Escallonia herrerae]